MQFYQYLTDNNVITVDQFKQSSYTVVENKLMIGQLAYLKGYLSKRDVNRTLLEQTDSKLRFGEICVENQLMTPFQVDELLEIQSQNHNILSEALLKEKILKEKDIYRHLRHFKDHIANDNQTGLEEAIYKNSPVLNSIIDILKGFFFNEGYVPRFETVESNLDLRSGSVSFASELKLSRQSSCYMCLNLDRLIASNIAAVKQRSYSRVMDTSEYLDLFTEIIFCLNYKITQSLRSLGYKVKHGASQAYLPRYEDCVSLEYKTILGPVRIALLS